MTDLMTILEIVFVIMLCVPIACLVVWQVMQLRARLRQEEKENSRNARMTQERARYQDPYARSAGGAGRSSSRDRRGRKKRSRGRVDRSGRDGGRRPLY